jgi:hypothetical protein
MESDEIYIVVPLFANKNKVFNRPNGIMADTSVGVTCILRWKLSNLCPTASI